MKYHHDVEEKVSKEYGFKNIDEIVLLGFEKHTGEYELIRDFIYDLCLEAQREALKNASENAYLNGSEYSRCGCEINKESIINENNILK